MWKKIVLVGLIALAGSPGLTHAMDVGRDSARIFEGMPLPWPFPWAKECPIIWSSISGRYLLQDSSSNQMDLKVSVLARRGVQLVQISRHDGDGVLIAEGMEFITLNQRAVQVYLRPTLEGVNPMWAGIKFYHDSKEQSCELDRLVPILSLIEKNPFKVETQYRLIRVPLNPSLAQVR